MIKRSKIQKRNDVEKSLKILMFGNIIGNPAGKICVVDEFGNNYGQMKFNKRKKQFVAQMPIVLKPGKYQIRLVK